MRTRAAAAVVVFAVGLALTACGGGGSKSAATTTTSESSASSSDSSSDTDTGGATGSDEKVPQFASDFDRVCTTQVGYPGVTAYEQGPGVHPVALFEDNDEGGFVSSSRSLPDGWAVEEDSNFEDNSELVDVELVACSKRVKETPTGVQCEFDNDGEKVNLELVDGTYEVKVYSASSGKEVGAATLEAQDSECPFIAVFEKGDTQYFNEPSDDDYINALKAHVAP